MRSSTSRSAADTGTGSATCPQLRGVDKSLEARKLDFCLRVLGLALVLGCEAWVRVAWRQRHGEDQIARSTYTLEC